MSEPKELQVSQQMDAALLCTAAELQYRQNIALRGRASGLTCVCPPSTRGSALRVGYTPALSNIPAQSMAVHLQMAGSLKCLFSGFGKA